MVDCSCVRDAWFVIVVLLAAINLTTRKQIHRSVSTHTESFKSCTEVLRKFCMSICICALFRGMWIVCIGGTNAMKLLDNCVIRGRSVCIGCSRACTRMLCCLDCSWLGGIRVQCHKQGICPRLMLQCVVVVRSMIFGVLRLGERFLFDFLPRRWITFLVVLVFV